MNARLRRPFFYQVRYLNPVTKVADKCDFCAESRLAKGFPPICVSACPEHALIFGREDSPEIQAWLQQNKYYQYQLPGAGKPPSESQVISSSTARRSGT